ncbi:MAG TPA: DUF481 domain-containing protein [Kofleriaceae bacterium]|nr:DUF481 domain-containing protein [Kofleriaceae bacterium]
MSRVWLVILVVSVVPHVAHAQIVNVQGALAKAPDKDDVGGQVELKVNWRAGNNPLFDLGGAGSILIRRGRVLGLLLARGEYGTSRGLTLTKKSFEHLRTRIELDCVWRWEVFAQHEYDQFRRLSLRALAGTGPALQLLHTKPVAVLAGAAYLLEYERLDTRSGTIDAGERTTAHRASLYVTGHENLGSGVAIVETAYAQPRLDDPGDVRILGEFSLLSQLSSRIALKNSFTLAYDRTPPDGIKRYDTQLEVAVVVTF